MGTLVLASNLVLSESESDTNLPLLGWKNIVASTNIAADDADPNYPASNLANPATNLRWLSTSTGVQYVTLTTGTADDIDYVGIAKHNLASAGIAVSVDGFDGSSWTELIAPSIPATDGPIMFRFTAGPFAGVRLKLAAGSAAPTIAVMYCGKLLALDRKIYQNQTPIPYGRVGSVTNGRSESGNFLGRIVTGESLATSVPLLLIDPDWYRANLDQFLAQGKNLPFFFAWRPDDYPAEVGYCWLTNDPVPVNAPQHGLISMTLALGGIV